MPPDILGLKCRRLIFGGIIVGANQALLMSDDRICELCSGTEIVDGRACPNCGGVFAAPPASSRSRVPIVAKRRSQPLVPKNRPWP